MTYPERWTRGWLILAAVGVGVAFLVWQPLVVALSLALTSLAAAALLVMLGTRFDSNTPPLLTLRSWRHLVGTAMALGVGATAVTLVAMWSWVFAALTLAAAFFTSPWVVARLKECRLTAPPAAVTGPHHGPMHALHRGRPGVDPQSARRLSTADLCAAWRISLHALACAPDTQARIHVVSARQVYLDEMERRSPAAVQAWLAADALAAQTPDWYLGGDDFGSTDRPNAA